MDGDVSAGQEHRHVAEEGEEGARQDVPVHSAELPQARGRQDHDPHARELRLPRRAREGVRRPGRPLRGAGRRDDRRARGRQRACRHRDPPRPEDRQARRQQEKRRRRGAQARLRRARRREGAAQRDGGVRRLLRPRRRDAPARARAAPGPRLQAGRLEGAGGLLHAQRLQRRRPVPRPGRHRRGPRRRRRGGQPQRGAQVGPRRVQRLLRRHELLLRARPGRRPGGARQDGRVQGGPAQPRRADGAAPGRRRHPHLLPAARRQHRRLRHHDAGAGRHEARPGRARGDRRGRQGAELLEEHGGARGRRRPLRLLAVHPRHEVDLRGPRPRARPGRLHRDRRRRRRRPSGARAGRA